MSQAVANFTVMTEESDSETDPLIWLGPEETDGFRQYGVVEVLGGPRLGLLQSLEISTSNETLPGHAPVHCVRLRAHQLVTLLEQVSKDVEDGRQQGLLWLCGKRLLVQWSLQPTSQEDDGYFDELAVPSPDHLIAWNVQAMVPDPDNMFTGAGLKTLPRRFGLPQLLQNSGDGGTKLAIRGYATRRIRQVRWTCEKAAEVAVLALEANLRGAGVVDYLPLAEITARSIGAGPRYLDAVAIGLMAGEAGANLIMPVSSQGTAFDQRRHAMIESIVGLAVGWEFYSELEIDVFAALVGIPESVFSRQRLIPLDSGSEREAKYERLVDENVIELLGLSPSCSFLLDMPSPTHGQPEDPLASLRRAHRALAAVEATDLRLSPGLRNRIQRLVDGDSEKFRLIEESLIALSAYWFLPREQAALLQPFGTNDAMVRIFQSD